MFHKFPVMLRCALALLYVGSTGHSALGDIRTIHIDFGLDTQQTVGAGWNNFTGPGQSEPTTTLNLVDTMGAVTGVQLVPTWSFTGNDTGVALETANYNGPYPSALNGIPQSALRDSLYVQDGANLTLTLSNLPAGSRYSFLFYGAAGNVGDYSLYTVTGSTSVAAGLTPLVNNSTEVATIAGIQPDAMQKIAIRFAGRRPDGSPPDPAVNDDARGRLNFMQIAQFLAPFPAVGDYNADSMIDSADQDIWRANFGTALNLTADGSGNGFVDAADYVVWRKAMTSGSEPGMASSVAVVPEPLTSTLLVIALVSLCAAAARRAHYPR